MGSFSVTEVLEGISGEIHREDRVGRLLCWWSAWVVTYGIYASAGVLVPLAIGADGGDRTAYTAVHIIAALALGLSFVVLSFSLKETGNACFYYHQTLGSIFFFILICGSCPGPPLCGFDLGALASGPQAAGALAEAAAFMAQSPQPSRLYFSDGFVDADSTVKVLVVKANVGLAPAYASADAAGSGPILAWHAGNDAAEKCGPKEGGLGGLCGVRGSHANVGDDQAPSAIQEWFNEKSAKCFYNASTMTWLSCDQSLAELQQLPVLTFKEPSAAMQEKKVLVIIFAAMSFCAWLSAFTFMFLKYKLRRAYLESGGGNLESVGAAGNETYPKVYSGSFDHPTLGDVDIKVVWEAAGSGYWEKAGERESIKIKQKGRAITIADRTITFEGTLDPADGNIDGSVLQKGHSDKGRFMLRPEAQ